MIYIASPFTHANKQIEYARYNKACKYVHYLMATVLEHAPFSPIVYGYPLHHMFNLPGDFEAWQRFNTDMLAHADEMHVLMLEGWEKSKGVQWEISQWQLRHDGHYTLSYIKGDAGSKWLETSQTG